MSETAVESPTPATETPATPATQEPVTQEPGTTETGTTETVGSEAQPQAAPAEETFFSGDVNSLSPKERETHDNMLRDYKKKTAEIAEQRRGNELAIKKSQIYDQLSQDQEFVRLYNQRRNGQAQPQTQEAAEPQSFQLSEEDFLKTQQSPEGLLELLDKYHEFKSAGTVKDLKVAQQKIQAGEAAEIVGDYETEKDKDGKLVHPMFEKLSNALEDEGVPGGLVQYFLNQDPAQDEGQWRGKLDRAYGRAERLYKKIHSEGKNEGLGILEKKSAQSTEPPAQSPSSLPKVVDPTKITTQEAVAAALKHEKLW